LLWGEPGLLCRGLAQALPDAGGLCWGCWGCWGAGSLLGRGHGSAECWGAGFVKCWRAVVRCWRILPGSGAGSRKSWRVRTGGWEEGFARCQVAVSDAGGFRLVLARACKSWRVRTGGWEAGFARCQVAVSDAGGFRLVLARALPGTRHLLYAVAAMRSAEWPARDAEGLRCALLDPLR
jgi:hypothetical protein